VAQGRVRQPGRAAAGAPQPGDGEAEGLTRLAVEQAFAGDPAALKLCLARTVAPAVFAGDTAPSPLQCSSRPC